jgi:excisionase family DNA binding protein
MERRTYTVTEAATVLGISRTSAYELVRAGTLPSLRLGRRIVIIRRALEELVGAPIPDPRARDEVRTAANEAPPRAPGDSR